ncbi:MAG: tRNA pseudouridine(54/55) synthase Pus10 [Candidatus Thermoplasmatota archaeon]|nr:tRNA pseudouridine(54/55) synthase Pus10 [Candidatus Thermoplasmatota archaeon]
MALVIDGIERIENQLCDRCLGRLFGKLGHGFNNETRGRAIRYALKNNIYTMNEEDIIQYSELSAQRKECALCKNLFDEIENFAELIVEKLKHYEFNTFLIGSKVDKEITDKEEELWKEFGLSYAEPIKTEINREVGKIVSSKIGKEADFKAPEITAIIDTRYDYVEVISSPLFIYGRYRKLVRDIPQTKWPCKRCFGKGCEYCNFKGKIYSSSVEEIIAGRVMEITKGEAHKLHGLGREDVDARVLGSGRPFILEIKAPKNRFVDLAKLEQEINKLGKDCVEISELRFTNFKEVVEIKGSKAPKIYRVELEFEAPIDEQKIKELESRFSNLSILQRTPLRVAHRRADKVRERKVLELKVESAKPTSAKLLIKCEAGLYIKELVTGDEDRTKPSIAELLGKKAWVKELDVVGVEYGKSF